MADSRYRELKVWVEDRPVGVLARARGPGRRTSFRYLPDVAEADAVSLTMLVRPESFEYPHGLHPIFAQNLPEGEQRTLINERFAKATESGAIDDFDLLRITGGTQVGRLRVTPVDQVHPPSRPGHYAFEALVGTGDNRLFQDLLGLYEEGFGVSGVQPKVLVDDTDAQGAFAPGMAHAEKAAAPTRRFIVKTWGERFPELALNEHFCMRCAHHAGLTAPQTWLSRDRKRLVVERFDYDPDADRYLAFEESAVLLGKTPDLKYTGSYERMADALFTFISPQHGLAARHQLFDTLALSSLLENGDFHLKNSGILYRGYGDEGGVRAAPVYDLVTTTVYLPSDRPALTLDGRKIWPDEETLLRFAKRRCGIQPKRARAHLARLATSIEASAKELENHVREHVDAAVFAARLLARWARGLGRYPTTSETAARVRACSEQLANTQESSAR